MEKSFTVEELRAMCIDEIAQSCPGDIVSHWPGRYVAIRSPSAKRILDLTHDGRTPLQWAARPSRKGPNFMSDQTVIGSIQSFDVFRFIVEPGQGEEVGVALFVDNQSVPSLDNA